MFKYKWVGPTLVGLLILCFTSYLFSVGRPGDGGLLNYIEKPLEDTLRKSKMTEERQPDDRIKIIKIDEPSLKAIGKFPWDRSVYARMIDKLEQEKVAAIGLDVVLAEPSKDPADDKQLGDVLAKYNNIVLATQFNYPAKQTSADALVPDKIDYPSDSLKAKRNQIAHVNVFQDKDTRVRKIPVGLPDEKNEMIYSFGAAMANFVLPKEKQVQWDAEKKQWLRDGKPIPVSNRYEATPEFYSEPRQKMDAATGYETFSFSDILNGKVDAPLEGALVFIGPFETGMMDEYLTPESNAIKMFGIEIHANMTQSVLENNFITYLDRKIGYLIIALLTLLSVIVFERIRGRAAIFIFIGSLIAYTVAWIICYSSNLVIPLTYPLLAIIAVYVYSIVSHYLAERKERSRVTNIFGRFVSKSVVDELLSSGQDVKLGGVRRDITLIFVDIRGFTPMSERLEPEQVIQVLNEYLDVCTKAIFKFNGTLDKFIGDGVMAMFGAPIEFDNHPEMAVKAALEMKKQSDDLEKKLIERIGIGVKFGLGINSGPAVVGNIGSEGLRLDYTAIGDTVNLSARLESNAKPGQILISENTYARVKDLFDILPVGEIKVKGKEKPVMVYEVLGYLAQNNEPAKGIITEDVS